MTLAQTPTETCEYDWLEDMLEAFELSGPEIFHFEWIIDFAEQMASDGR